MAPAPCMLDWLVVCRRRKVLIMVGSDEYRTPRSGQVRC
jgi:hypothetical protein